MLPPQRWSRVYFPFADAALAYDCGECDARCCRTGGGFGLPRVELAALRAHLPTLDCFARASANADYVSVTAGGARCLLLDEGGRCLVQAAHGRAPKPYVCKTFPANNFLLLDDVLVADLHPLCPLCLPRGSAGETVLRHDELCAGLEEYHALIAQRARRGPGRLGGAPLGEVLAYEAWARDLLAGAPDPDPLWLAAALLTGAHGPGAGSVSAPTLADERAALREHRARLRHWFGVAGTAVPDVPDVERAHETARCLALVFPRLRLRLLVNYPTLVWADVQRAAPRMLVGGSLYLELARAANGALPLTPATVFELLDESLEVLWLLAHLDAVPWVPVEGGEQDRVSLPASQVVSVNRVLSFLHRENQRAGLTLAAVLEQEAGGAPDELLDRLLLLRCLGEKLLDRIRFAPQG